MTTKTSASNGWLESSAIRRQSNDTCGCEGTLARTNLGDGFAFLAGTFVTAGFDTVRDTGFTFTLVSGLTASSSLRPCEWI